MYYFLKIAIITAVFVKSSNCVCITICLWEQCVLTPQFRKGKIKETSERVWVILITDKESDKCLNIVEYIFMLIVYLRNCSQQCIIVVSIYFTAHQSVNEM